MATIEVQPRDTPAERSDASVRVEVEEVFSDHASIIEDWVEPRQAWTVTLREGHDFGRANNVEARLLFTGPGHTCSLTFRLDQLDRIQVFDRELWLTLDERDGVARAAHLAPTGLDVELFHLS